MGLVPPLLILAGLALTHAGRWFRGAPLVAGLVALIVTTSSLAGVRQDNPGVEMARLGEVLLRQDRVEEAVRLLERAHELDPGAITVAYVLAESYDRAGRFEEAIPLYRQVRAARPDDPDLPFNEGVALLQLERYAEAAEAFQVALALRADAAYWVNLGAAREGQGETKAAADAYRAGIALAPEEELGYLRLGALLVGAGSLEEGAAIFEEGLRRLPRSFDLRHMLALAHAQAGRPEAALEEVERLLGQRPGHPDVVRLKQWLEATLGRRSAPGGEGEGSGGR